MKGVTEIPPVWAVLQDTADAYHVARISTEGDSVAFSNFLKVGMIGHDGRVITRRHSTYLFIVPKFGNQLWVIDVEKEPKVILNKDLQELNIRGVVELVPY
jgi:hypothetical protein